MNSQDSLKSISIFGMSVKDDCSNVRSILQFSPTKPCAGLFCRLSSIELDDPVDDCKSTRKLLRRLLLCNETNRLLLDMV